MSGWTQSVGAGVFHFPWLSKTDSMFWNEDTVNQRMVLWWVLGEDSRLETTDVLIKNHWGACLCFSITTMHTLTYLSGDTGCGVFHMALLLIRAKHKPWPAGCGCHPFQPDRVHLSSFTFGLSPKQDSVTRNSVSPYLLLNTLGNV